MSMNSGGGGRAGRGPALNRLIENARKKQHRETYSKHEYDGCDPDNLEGEPA